MESETTPDTTAETTGEWYWCLRHQRAEGPEGCAADQRLGPYETKAAAESYADRVDARNERWDADDRRWHGGS